MPDLTQITGGVVLPDGSVPYEGRIHFTPVGWDCPAAGKVQPPATRSFELGPSGGLVDVYLSPSTTSLREMPYRVSVTHFNAATRAMETTDLGLISVPEVAEGDSVSIRSLLSDPGVIPAAPDALAQVTAKAAEVSSDRAAAQSARTAAEAAAAIAQSGTDVSVEAFSELSSRLRYSGATGSQINVAVGLYVRDRSTGSIYRVLSSGASGADLDYTGSGGVKLSVIPLADRQVQPVAQRRVQLFEILKAKVRPQWFTGYTSAWSGDCTAAMQAALQYAADEQRTLAIEEPATVSELFLLPGQRVEFDGPRFAPESGDGASWRAARGANPTSGYLVSLYHSGTPSDWHWRGVQLISPVIFGDMTYQPNTFGLLSIDNEPSPDASINPRHVVQGFWLREAPGTAFYIGSRTYDGRYQDGNIYKARGYGLHYAGVDSQISNVNVARAYNHNVYIRGSEVRILGLKSWGAGDYYTTDPGLVAGVNPTLSCGIYSYRAEAVALIGAKTQECARNGLRIVDGGVGQEARDWDVVAYDSDGDCRATSGPAIHMERVLRSKFQCNVDRRNSGFLGTITRAVSAITGTTDCEFDVTYNASVVTSFPIELSGSIEGNAWRLNNHDRKTTSASVISSYTPNPLTAQRYRLTMGEGNLTLQNPGAKPAGFRLEFEFIQTSATPRSIAFGTDFKVPTGWSPTTTAGKRAFAQFVSDGTNWIPTAFVNEA